MVTTGNLNESQKRMGLPYPECRTAYSNGNGQKWSNCDLELTKEHLNLVEILVAQKDLLLIIATVTY